MLFIVLMPFLIEGWTPERIVLMVAMELTGILLIMGLYNPRRFNWAVRGVTTLVFLAYLVYLVDEMRINGFRFTLAGRRSEASSRNALIGFIVIGLPCLWYSLLGRFTLRREEESEAEENDTDQMN
jgi:hypothetical protein